MVSQRRKTTRSERRAQPMPKLIMPHQPTETDQVKQDFASRSFQNDQNVSAADVKSKSKPKSLPTRKQRLKRERGVELAAKLQVKANRKAIRQANRNGAKKIYE